MNHIFHVHTWRCKHASDETDEQYIKTALSLGASKITFTDHTPFLGDTFRNRMELSQLSEYVQSLKVLRAKYKDKIDVQIGLEVEFLPSMLEFYQQLKNDYDLDLLIIGQHFYEHTDGRYSFDDEKEFNTANEFSGCGNAIIQGIKTGLFSVVAHPDRIFRRCKEWTPEMNEVAENIIRTAAENNIILERNLSSYEKYVTKSRTAYWKNEFWDLVEQFNYENEAPVKLIEGLDAHSSEEMISRFKYADAFECNMEIKMKTKKDFPATHSMSTEWFVVDEDGNIAFFDFEEEGPVPVQIDESDSFSYMEDLCVPNENGINSLELNDEQIADILKHFRPISEFTENDDYSCLVQLKDDEDCLKEFIKLFKAGIECCLSHKERVYLVHDFLKYNLPEDLKKEIIESIKQVCTGFYQAVCEGDYLSSEPEPVYPLFCYQQPYNSSSYLPKRTAVPAHPLKEEQIPEEKRKKLIRIPVKFSECTGFQIAQYVLCKWHYGFDYIERDGRTYFKFPKTGGGFCYILEDQDIETDGEVPIVIDGEEKDA